MTTGNFARRYGRVLFFALAAALLFCALFLGTSARAASGEAVFEQRIGALEQELILSRKHNFSAEVKYDTMARGYAVFVSISDGAAKASVHTGTGENVAAAFSRAAEKARLYVQKSGIVPKWVKADVVVTMNDVALPRYNGMVSMYGAGFFRQGVAFSPDFELAFLEAEMNANGMIDYERDTLSLTSINAYLLSTGKAAQMEALPEEFTLFTTKGFLCDEDGTIFALSSSGADYGRRKTENPNSAYIAAISKDATAWLRSQVEEDGGFIYGYYPMDDSKITGYNIMRHTGSVWILTEQYMATGDKSLVSGIEKSLKYMLGNVKKKGDAAYVLEKTAGEIKLGANSLAIIALTKYMDAFDTAKYTSDVNALARGILSMQDAASGKFSHVLRYPSYELKADFRTTYYDGQGAFALAAAYGATGNEAYLNGARKALDYFISKDYHELSDHWVSYAINEVTKYDQSERYLEFGLKNAMANLSDMRNRRNPAPTCLELMMVTFELYDRIAEQKLEVAYLKEFRESYFIDAIFYRVQHMLNGHFYPEVAMYMQRPDSVLGAFFARDDFYRTRIDDVQHFLGGYTSFVKNYDRLRYHQNRLNVGGVS